MERIHTEIMMGHFPGLCVCAMENGGMCFSEDGDYVDAVDQPRDPLRDWMDFENGDGDKGHLTLGSDDVTHLDDEEDENEDDLSGDELERLMAEQHADDTDLIIPETFGPATEKKHISKTKLRAEAALVAGREPIRFDEQSDDCYERDSGRRTNGKGGWIARNRGQKPEYKDRRLRAAGSGKTRAVIAH